MKKVLFVAYHFPPSNAVGGLRIAKFVRYLPSFGWEPTVLTVKDCYRNQMDTSRLKDLGEVRIIKTMQLPVFTKFLLSIKRASSVFLNRKKIKERTLFEDQYGEILGQIRSETFFKRLKRYYIALSSCPDDERCWVIPGALQAIINIRQGTFDCMMTSSPPHSSHLIGVIAKKVMNVKWVADFRDPWIEILPNRSPLIRSELSDNVEIWLEKLIVHTADKIITTTDEHRKAIIARFPDEPLSKFVYIPNGIDSSKFNTKELPERYGKFTISYAGTIYLKRTPEPVFRAIHKLISSGKIQPEEIRFKLFGECELIDGRPIYQIIKAYGLESIIEVSKSIPFLDSIKIMQRSHLLLLLATPVQEINIPAKIYDYFGSGSKIITISEPGAASRLIEITNSGVCFNPTNIDGIAEYIFEFMKNPDRDNVRNDPSFYAHFDTKILTGKLAEQFSSLA